MRKGYFTRFALESLRKNKRYYAPYILTCVVMEAMLYIIAALADHPGMGTMVGGDSLSMFLHMGTIIILIFAFLFQLFTHNFLMKQRRSEFGLYHVLGMEKRHVGRIIGTETLILAVVCHVLGLFFGILLNKLALLGLMRLLGETMPLGFRISARALVVALVAFSLFHLVLFVISLVRLRLSSAIALLRSGQMGEKEPRARWILAILGALCLAGGYYISVTTENPLEAVLLFFLAVMLVIFGTFLLFTAGSIAWLKLMKSRKNYYYQPRHFITVSGMLYRMKQNAASLATICILSTMVLVTLSATTSLYLGAEDTVNQLTPRQYKLEVATGGTAEGMDEFLSRGRLALDEYLAEEGLTPENRLHYLRFSGGGTRHGDSFTLDDVTNLDDNAYWLAFLCLEDYNRAAGTDLRLEPDQVLLYQNRRGLYDEAAIELLGRRYTVAGRVEDEPAETLFASSSLFYGQLGIVFPSRTEMLDFYRDFWSVVAEDGSYSFDEGLREFYHFDLPGVGTADMELLEEMENLAVTAPYFGEEAGEQIPYEFLSANVDSHAMLLANSMGLYAGLFFVGIFLSLLFAMATILMIYYKQISEGLQDARRFAIMQQVGLSLEEIRRSIRSQVMTVFFLPLVTAGIHCAFAFPILSRLLSVLYMSNTLGFIRCMLFCFAGFALLYVLVYGLTARVYYNIVSTRER